MTTITNSTTATAQHRRLQYYQPTSA